VADTPALQRQGAGAYKLLTTAVTGKAGGYRIPRQPAVRLQLQAGAAGAGAATTAPTARAGV